MNEEADRTEALFYEAINLPRERQLALLEAAGASDPGLRARLEKLLADDARLGTDGKETPDFLESPLVRALPTLAAAASWPESDREPPPSIARYRILGVLGEGGMGSVYQAEQDSPRRSVALKVIRPGLVSAPLLKRFEQEARILGLLHHPGIAAIYEAGVAQDGQPFFAMEFVRGLALDEYARRHNLDDSARLELLARVADAVQHAHEHGIVHRDLKPTNILVDETGQPKVLDFGVSRGLGEQLRPTTAHTQTGQLLGTPRYMSPEQVAADPNLDRRSDVYTLGVILFELLVGQLPYPLEGRPLGEVVWLIHKQEPARLGALQRRLRGDVETIVGRALEKEPQRRYPSAAELAADIRRHLRHEPIQARPPSALYRLGKLARRHKALVATTAAFLAVLLVAGAAAAWQAVRAERDQADRLAHRSQEVAEALGRAAALREQARATNDQGQWAEARGEAGRAGALAQGGPVAPGLAEQVQHLLDELNEEEKDRRLLARLEKVRLLQAELNVKESRFAWERALPEYSKVFAAYGLAAGEAEPAEAAARIRRRPPGVQGTVVAALDSWLDLARQEKAAEASWLGRVLAAADPDDWRQRVRAAQGRQAPQALLDLAREVKVATQPPQALVVLGHALVRRGSTDAAVELLRRAWDAYPDDFWINHGLGFHLAESSKPPQLDEAIAFLRVAVALRPRSPGAQLNLGKALSDKGQWDKAIACYHKAIALDPKYAAAHSNLGNALMAKGQVEDAIACYHKAIDLDPKLANAHYNLGNALYGKRQEDKAIACWKKAIALDPKFAKAHYNLGLALYGKRQVDAAIACYHKAIDLDPELALAHTNLGAALSDKGQVDEAIACYNKAIALDPKLANAHYNLGLALSGKGQVDAAIACYHKAIEFDPKLANAHYNLGNALYGKGQVDAAIACYHKAIEFDPNYAEAHSNLGLALYGKRQEDKAIACWKKAIALDPKYAAAHYNLGNALSGKGQVDAAIACYHKAIEFDPNYAEAHCNLGHALARQGRFAQSLVGLKRGHELGSKRTGWPYPSAAWVRQAEANAALEAKLPALLKGEYRPGDNKERLGLAAVCQVKKFHHTATGLYAAAFAADARLADDLHTGHRYNAACRAALAAAGVGEDAGKLDDKGRAGLRKQALGWLRDDLAGYTKLGESGRQADRAFLQQRLKHWQKDTDLAGVRDKEALAKLPADEQKAFAQLWDDVAATLAEAREGSRPAALPGR